MEPVSMEGCAVHKSGAVWSLFPAPTSVDMPEDVQPRPDSLDGFVELHTAHVLTADVLFVENAERWAMGDQHVGFGGHLVPVLGGVAARHGKGHVWQNRGHRAAPEVDTFERDGRLFEVDGGRQPGPGQLGLGLKQLVVVAGHDDLVFVRQAGKPGVEVVELFSRGAGRRKVPGMDKNLRIGHVQPSVKTVRVADAYDAHKSIILCR